MSQTGIFVGLVEEINKGLIEPFSEKVNDVIRLIEPIGTTALLIFIMFYGYMILMGKVQAPAKEFLWRVGTIVLVFWVAFSPDGQRDGGDPGRYSRYVKEPIIHSTMVITKLTAESGQNGKFGGLYGKEIKTGSTNQILVDTTKRFYLGLDIVFESVNIFTSGIMDAVQSFQKIPPKVVPGETADEKAAREALAKQTGKDNSGMIQNVTIGVVGMILTGAVMLYVTSGVLLLLNHIFLIILLTLGPMFLALSAFKMTRDYAKKWLVKLVTVALTLALVTSMLGFVLTMQGTVSGHLCGVTVELQNQMIKQIKATNPDGDTAEAEKTVKRIKGEVLERLESLKILAMSDLNTLNVSGPNEDLVRNIIEGCGSAGDASDSGESDSNLLFVAMQYLVVCMIFSRLITEMANLASAIVGASGMNGNASEVSGSSIAQGARQGGAASNASKNMKTTGKSNDV